MRIAHCLSSAVVLALFLLPSWSLSAASLDDASTLRGVLVRRHVPSPQDDRAGRNKAMLAIYVLRLNTPYSGPQPWGKPGGASYRYRELQVICNTHFITDCDAVLRRNTGRTVRMTGAVTAAIEPNEVYPMIIEPSFIQEGKAH